MRVSHAKVSASADTGDASLIQPSDWNSDHDLSGLVADNDPRLSDARTPSAHDHDYADPHPHPYAADDHGHTAYSGTAHNHDSAYLHAHPYSGTAHAHDSSYSATGHAHASYATTDDLTAHEGTPHGGEGSQAFPVGAVFLAVVNTDPATLLGYGTWSAFGAGRMLVGRDSGDTDFDTAEETGGAKTHTHAAHTGVINHTHTVTVTDGGHVHAQQRFPTATGGSTGFTVDTSMSGTPAAANNTASATTGITASTANPAGGTNELTHDTPSHLPPYIVVYMWKRTA